MAEAGKVVSEEEPSCKKPRLAELDNSVQNQSLVVPCTQKEDVHDNKELLSQENERSDDSNLKSCVPCGKLKEPSTNSSKYEGIEKSAAVVTEAETTEDEEAIGTKIESICDEGEGNTAVGRLTEMEAGISEYLSDHGGFSAIIKQRYSDFIVNEIDPEGNVVHLTKPSHEESAEDKDEVKECPTSDVLKVSDLAELEKMVQDKDKKGSVNIAAPADKEARTKIHLAIKQSFTQLETKTVEVDGQKCIQAVWRKGKQRDTNRDEWPKSKKSCRYVKFVLYKENKDTMDAIGLIAKNLKVKESMFQYAGTKDKRAKTSQLVTAHRIHPKKLAFLNKVLWNMGLGDFSYVSEPLKLGQLSGNRFSIVLRNVQAEPLSVDRAVENLKMFGFINYFGMQRFGTTSIPTHRVGSSLLKGDWEKAVDLILLPRQDNPSKSQFQKVWADTHDPEATLKVTPRYCGLERHLLEALCKNMKPFNALEKVSRNTRLLYVHSYQSLVWNKMTSRRLRQLGHRPVLGDLVLPAKTGATDLPKPTVLSEENLSQFSLSDVVLPLPGHQVIYPSNEVAQWYRETLQSDGLDMDNMKRPQKDYSLPGAYRHIVVQPSDISWSHCRYDDYTEALLLSDLDLLNGESISAGEQKGKFSALVLHLSLPTSSYATMALREILKVDTSAGYQSSLNVT